MIIDSNSCNSCNINYDPQASKKAVILEGQTVNVGGQSESKGESGGDKTGGFKLKMKLPKA